MVHCDHTKTTLDHAQPLRCLSDMTGVSADFFARPDRDARDVGRDPPRLVAIDLGQSPTDVSRLVFPAGQSRSSGVEDARVCVDHNCNAIDLRSRQRNPMHGQSVFGAVIERAVLRARVISSRRTGCFPDRRKAVELRLAAMGTTCCVRQSAPVQLLNQRRLKAAFSHTNNSTVPSLAI
jgi:hypothetical protein